MLQVLPNIPNVFKMENLWTKGNNKGDVKLNMAKFENLYFSQFNIPTQLTKILDASTGLNSVAGINMQFARWNDKISSIENAFV